MIFWWLGNWNTTAIGLTEFILSYIIPFRRRSTKDSSYVFNSSLTHTVEMTPDLSTVRGLLRDWSVASQCSVLTRAAEGAEHNILYLD